jgi:hypothetical protein
MTNIDDNGNSVRWENKFYRTEINLPLILRMIELARQNGSNPTLSIWDVEFNFWINPMNFNQGASIKKVIGEKGKGNH